MKLFIIQMLYMALLLKYNIRVNFDIYLSFRQFSVLI